MIDIKTGNLIKRPEGIVIKPSISEKEFNSLPFEKERINDHKYQVNYVRHRDVLYQFNTFDSVGNSISVRIGFSANSKEGWKYSISSVHFINIQVAEMYDDFFERLENTKIWHDEWMKKSIGASPIADFWWGRLESFLSVKAEESSIALTYSKDIFEKTVSYSTH
jgi:hypothetical protein